MSQASILSVLARDWMRAVGPLLTCRDALLRVRGQPADMHTFQRSVRRCEGISDAVETVRQNARGLSEPVDLDRLVDAASDASCVFVEETSALHPLCLAPHRTEPPETFPWGV